MLCRFHTKPFKYFTVLTAKRFTVLKFYRFNCKKFLRNTVFTIYLFTFAEHNLKSTNPMVISVTSLKGGVGKSTISQNLAVCFAHAGYKTCIVDSDTNQSSVRWSGLRAEEQPSIFVSGLPDGKELAKNVKILNESFEIILIDGTPSLSAMTSKILLLADLVVIPVLPSALDLWATQLFLDRLTDAKEQREQHIPAYFALNQYDERTSFSRETREALDALGAEGLRVFKTPVKNRAAYKKAIVEGLGVFEFSDAKAREEMVSLFNEVQAVLKSL